MTGCERPLWGEKLLSACFGGCSLSGMDGANVDLHIYACCEHVRFRPLISFGSSAWTIRAWVQGPGRPFLHAELDIHAANTSCTFFGSYSQVHAGQLFMYCCCCCCCWRRSFRRCVKFSKPRGCLSQEALVDSRQRCFHFFPPPSQNELNEQRRKVRQLNEQLQEKSPVGAGARAAAAQSAMKLRLKQAESVRKLERETTRYANPWRMDY